MSIVLNNGHVHTVERCVLLRVRRWSVVHKQICVLKNKQICARFKADINEYVLLRWKMIVHQGMPASAFMIFVNELKHACCDAPQSTRWGFEAREG